MMGGTILLGVAYGIAWILNQASVLDTIVYFISRLDPLGIPHDVG